MGSLAPTTPLWPFAVSPLSTAATGWMVTRTVSFCPVSVLATAFTMPRAFPPPMSPVNLPLILSRVVSVEVQAMSVPGRTAPSESLASAPMVMESPKETAVSVTSTCTVLAFLPGPV